MHNLTNEKLEGEINIELISTIAWKLTLMLWSYWHTPPQLKSSLIACDIN